jgi:murein DD-endopeptidase MepM/ murein hydrolase activator NlpD
MALDDVDGDLSGAISIDASAVQVDVAGSYEVNYDVSDSSDNAAETVVRVVQVEASPTKSNNMAASFGWRHFAETDLQLSEFYPRDFTLMIRVMVQYNRAHTGPFFAAAQGGFEVSKQSRTGQISARLGDQTFTYSSLELASYRWHHIAVVRRSNQMRLYVDGQLRCPENTADCAVDAGTASGLLRIGRAGNDPISGRSENQHYGFIDDLAVYTVALSPETIRQAAAKKRIDGREAALYAAWTFDDALPSGDALPAVLSRSVTYFNYTGSTNQPTSEPLVTIVSEARDSAGDASRLPAPSNQTPMRLPFPPGEAWLVTQGWQGAGSHNGRAAFALDFRLAGVPVSETEGRPFYAVAPGAVVQLEDDRTSCSGSPANHVDVEQAPGEHSVYLHHVIYSAAVAVGEYVVAGDYLADAGDTGNSGCNAFHLHFALHNLPESERNYLVTVPGAFENYEASNDEGMSWHTVGSGVPTRGQWVRNPPD